jgi:A/G-specific adenine glycosylase
MPRKKGNAAPTAVDAGHAPALTALRADLLAWYDAHARDLPWRRTRDPYAIWVSEVMLQQTRVDTVIPYFERFLDRFPSVMVLADAPLDAVLSAWSGLGYYRRARMLHGAARSMAEQHDGQVPRDPAARRALPGVGRYTAGAIGSIAFDLPEPIVDGNVARVLSRLFCIDTPLGTQATERVLWQLAESMAQGERPGALNQALMELGATVCTPDNAHCGRCPWAHACRARAEDKIDALPVPAKTKAPRNVRLCALVARRKDGRLWMLRSEDSLFHGLWGLPLTEGHGMDTALSLRDQLGLGREQPKAMGRVKHVLSHRVLDVDCYAVAAEAAEDTRLRAYSEPERAALGIAKLTEKLLSQAG